MLFHVSNLKQLDKLSENHFANFGNKIQLFFQVFFGFSKIGFLKNKMRLIIFLYFSFSRFWNIYLKKLKLAELLVISDTKSNKILISEFGFRNFFYTFLDSRSEKQNKKKLAFVT